MSTVLAHESYVADRFDRLRSRFKSAVAADDFRLRALVRRLEPLHARRVLDLGCGKGRFAVRLRELGAEVVGLDLSEAMLGEAEGLDRVRGSARRLPFAGASFDAAIAVEALEHMADLDGVIAEVARVLRPGATFAVVDKNAGSLNAQRPFLPNLAVKWLDERRGRWMYPSGGPVRERWFWPGRFPKRLARGFETVEVEYLLSDPERALPLFRLVPRARLMTLWVARKSGGPRE